MSENLPTDAIGAESSRPLEIDENHYSSLHKSISELAKTLDDLNRQAVEEYTPIVNSILQSRSQDIGRIEHALDGLLDFCGHQPFLLLYKKLCRYYFDIDPTATVAYIDAYREHWDFESVDVNLHSFEDSSQ